MKCWILHKCIKARLLCSMNFLIIKKYSNKNVWRLHIYIIAFLRRKPTNYSSIYDVVCQDKCNLYLSCLFVYSLLLKFTIKYVLQQEMFCRLTITGHGSQWNTCLRVYFKVLHLRSVFGIERTHDNAWEFYPESMNSRLHLGAVTLSHPRISADNALRPYQRLESDTRIHLYRIVRKTIA